MSRELASVTADFVAALDSMDVDRLVAGFTEDAQGVDEISRRWLRGKSEVDSYLRQLMGAVSEVHTELRDQEERIWGDVGLLTCWLEQNYTMDGEAHHISAPTSIAFRREAGDWKMALFHSIPLPEQP